MVYGCDEAWDTMRPRTVPWSILQCYHSVCAVAPVCILLVVERIRAGHAGVAGDGWLTLIV